MRENRDFVVPVNILTPLRAPCFLGPHDTLPCVLILVKTIKSLKGHSRISTSLTGCNCNYRTGLLDLNTGLDSHIFGLYTFCGYVCYAFLPSGSLLLTECEDCRKI